MAMDPLLSTMQQLLRVPDDLEKLLNAPTSSYVCNTKAMASTPVDVKEYPKSYVFIIEMLGLKSNDIKVEKFMKKFTLPADCNLEAISAACQDGVTVTVPKLPRGSRINLRLWKLKLDKSSAAYAVLGF